MDGSYGARAGKTVKVRTRIAARRKICKSARRAVNILICLIASVIYVIQEDAWPRFVDG